MMSHMITNDLIFMMTLHNVLVFPTLKPQEHTSWNKAKYFYQSVPFDPIKMNTVKPVQNGHSQKDRKLVLKTNYCLMQVKSVAAPRGGEQSAKLSTFIKLPFVIKIFDLSFFEWLFYTLSDFTVHTFCVFVHL